MRLRLLATALLTLPLFVACAGSDNGDDGGPTPYDEEFPVSPDTINDGAPANDTLPDDNKADAVYPAKFELGDQSPVKSQGSRGVCSMFSATALVENLYLRAGMPAAEVDFSEQYLQWAVKNLTGSFANTDGSSSDANLKTVVRFGTVAEAVWPYESAPWNASNDPACNGGSSLPTRCYTNGEPPAAAESARKWQLPSSRWINTNSIKAHLTTKKTGVNVGMTFYYQSWNHRSSTLPISTELWRKGVVTFPNAADVTASLAKRAGHAIHIIGWDDNLEFPKRDGQGNAVLDAAGNPVKEKGFYLFKNSWGTASFGVEHPYGAGYGWLSQEYVHRHGSAVVAELPLLARAEVCDDEGGNDEDADGKANCDDSMCTSHPSCSGGGGTRTYSATPNATIPDDSVTGVSSTITVPDTGSLTDVKIKVDIAHSYRGDLKLTLTHGTFTRVLFDSEGGSADNLVTTFPVSGLTGAALAGDWVLKVEDGAAQDVGRLNSWAIEATAQ